MRTCSRAGGCGKCRPSLVAEVNAQSGADPTVLFVLGMHRSGTSALTRTLSLSGAGLPTRVLPPSTHNVAGHWEPQAVAVLNDELLVELDSAWDDVRSLPAEYWQGNEWKPFLARAVDVLRQEYGDAVLWVVKDPRISRLLGFWRLVCDTAQIQAKYVIVARHPAEVVGSIADRDGFSEKKSVLLWLRHYLDAEEGTKGQPRCFATYDELLSDWQRLVARIEAQLGVGLKITQDSAQTVNDFLRPDLRHHCANEEDLQRPGMPWQWAGAVYECLRRAASGSALDSEALAGIRQSVGGVTNSWTDGAADLRKERRMLRSRVAQLQSQALDLEGRLEQTHRQISRLERELQAVYESSSWRITAPLRDIASWARQRKEGRKLDGGHSRQEPPTPFMAPKND